jgi:hypothetical protein
MFVTQSDTNKVQDPESKNIMSTKEGPASLARLTTGRNKPLYQEAEMKQPSEDVEMHLSLYLY